VSLVADVGSARRLVDTLRACPIQGGTKDLFELYTINSLGIDRHLFVQESTDSEVRMKAYLKKHKLLLGAMIGSLVIVGLFISFGRSKTNDTPRPAPLEVEVAQVEQKDVPIYEEWIGTLDGMVNAEIRAQVSGYLLSKNYTEGSLVRKGQLLFDIDARPFQAALDQDKAELARAAGNVTQGEGQLLQAQAQLAQRQADQGRTQLDVDRYTPLAKENAITDQELDNAVQANLAAKAQIKAASAGVEAAKAAIVAAKAVVAAAEAALRLPSSTWVSLESLLQLMVSPASLRRRSATWSARPAKLLPRCRR
jgi:biotin/lipoyl-binding protein